MKIQLVYDEAYFDRIMEEALAELSEKPEHRKHLKATDRIIEDVEEETDG